MHLCDGTRPVVAPVAVDRRDVPDRFGDRLRDIIGIGGLLAIARFSLGDSRKVDRDRHIKVWDRLPGLGDALRSGLSDALRVRVRGGTLLDRSTDIALNNIAFRPGSPNQG